jgi:hypothetical protein
MLTCQAGLDERCHKGGQIRHALGRLRDGQGARCGSRSHHGPHHRPHHGRLEQVPSIAWKHAIGNQVSQIKVPPSKAYA